MVGMVHIARSSILAMQVHLLRALPLQHCYRQSIGLAAGRLDTEMRNVFTRITDIPVQPDCAAFAAPASTGGLGFTSLRREVTAHRTAHLLTERIHQRIDNGEWSGESMATFEAFSAEAETTLEYVLGKSIDMLHAEGYQRAMKKLRMPLYKAGI
eukprot:865414-Amphidinium_carterae.1